MKELSIDIETYSEVELKDSGVYRYASDSSFEILLIAYAYDNGPVQIVDLASGEQVPDALFKALEHPEIKKTAFNANFERVCLSERFPMIRINRDYIDPEQWECTMVKAAMLGLPMSLEGVGKALNIEKEKLDSGAALIRYFSKPCKATKANGGRTRNLPQDDPEKWEQFKGYCMQDVEAEREIKRRIAFFTIPQPEVNLYNLDQNINDTGIAVDMAVVKNAIAIDNALQQQLYEEVKNITKLDNPNSPAQLKVWLESVTALEFPSLTKDKVQELLDSDNLTNDARRILQIRQLMSKTSVKKYARLETSVCEDGRVRGLLQFYGANRTGRWAGRLVQVQNLPQNKIKDLDLARNLVLDGDTDTMDMVFANPASILSQLVRTAFVAPEGKTFVVSDFSAIEARVIAWLAGEQWRLDVFNSHGKIYEASAAKMLNKPIEKVTKEERGKGKIAELALGYQGSTGALLAMGALNMGLKEEELGEIVFSWRKSNPNITFLWNKVQDAAISVIAKGGKRTVNNKVSFQMQNGYLVITLPSGRSLYYSSAYLGVNRFNNSSIIYKGMNQTTKKWTKVETYGGKLVENIVQAIARDCLAVTLLRLESMGYKTVMHVHDEVIVEVDESFASEEMEMICEEMGTPIEWAEGLPLKGDGYITKYYKKD